MTTFTLPDLGEDVFDVGLHCLERGVDAGDQLVFLLGLLLPQLVELLLDLKLLLAQLVGDEVEWRLLFLGLRGSMPAWAAERPFDAVVTESFPQDVAADRRECAFYRLLRRRLYLGQVLVVLVLRERLVNEGDVVELDDRYLLELPITAHGVLPLERWG